MTTNMQLLIGSAIFCAGGITGFLTARYLLEEHYSALAQQEIDSVKEALGRHRHSEPSKPEVDELPVKVPKSTLYGSDSNDYVRAKTAYHKLAKEKEGIGSYMIQGMEEGMRDEEYEDESDPAIEAEIDSSDMIEVETNIPYVISVDEFTDTNVHYDKLTLFYYINDEVLTDDNEEIIANPFDVIGGEAISALATVEAVYVRNEPIATDYEVVRLTSSYKQLIMGVDEPPSWPKKVDSRRRIRERREAYDEES